MRCAVLCEIFKHVNSYSPDYHPCSPLGFALRPRGRGREIIRGVVNSTLMSPTCGAVRVPRRTRPYVPLTHAHTQLRNTQKCQNQQLPLVSGPSNTLPRWKAGSLFSAPPASLAGSSAHLLARRPRLNSAASQPRRVVADFFTALCTTAASVALAWDL